MKRSIIIIFIAIRINEKLKIICKKWNYTNIKMNFIFKEKKERERDIDSQSDIDQPTK